MIDIEEISKYADDDILPYKYCKQATDDGYQPYFNHDGLAQGIVEHNNTIYEWSPSIMKLYNNPAWAISKSEYLSFYEIKNQNVEKLNSLFNDYKELLDNCQVAKKTFDELNDKVEKMESEFDMRIKNCRNSKNFFYERLDDYAPVWNSIYKRTPYVDIYYYKVTILDDQKCKVYISFVDRGFYTNTLNIATKDFDINELLEFIKKNSKKLKKT